MPQLDIIDKLGAFALGVMTGIVGMAVATVIVDKSEGGHGVNGNAETSGSAKTNDEPDPTQG